MAYVTLNDLGITVPNAAEAVQAALGTSTVGAPVTNQALPKVSTLASFAHDHPMMLIGLAFIGATGLSLAGAVAGAAVIRGRRS